MPETWHRIEMTVLDKFWAGDASALSRIISHIENRGKDYRRLISKLYSKSGKAIKIGFTGPPGAGKSSLVNNISKLLAKEGKKVAVVAIDPSSPFTGGALLGDRIRLTDMPTDNSIYIRSMATRGSSGGLAAATGNVLIALDAFGFDYILIETVGVGQVELDIIDSCDTVVVVLVPESGDVIQTLKAGLMEIADIFAINKSDRPGSEMVVSEINSTLEMKRDKIDWELPVVATQALNNINMDILLEKIKGHVAFSQSTGLYEKHRQEQIRNKIYKILRSHLSNIIRIKLEGTVDLDKVVSEIYQKRTDPYTEAERLLELSSLKE